MGLTQDQPDADFCKFVDLAHGYRALARILRGYGRRGISTPNEIARTYAPAGDNNPVDAYAQVLAANLLVGRDDKMDMESPSTLRRLCLAITYMECLAGEIARGIAMERQDTAPARPPVGEA